MTGIGGDCFAIDRQAGHEKPIALNARRPRARGRDGGVVRKQASSASRPRTAHAVTVPGAIDGWTRLLEDHGTMPLERLLAPAIALAEGGFVVAPRVAADWANGARKFRPAGAKRTCSKTARCPGRRRHAVSGARQDAKRIAKEGRDGFYKGEIAKDMVAELNALGGLHTLEDFAAQSPPT